MRMGWILVLIMEATLIMLVLTTQIMRTKTKAMISMMGSMPVVEEGENP
jgi:hypothetical protein